METPIHALLRFHRPHFSTLSSSLLKLIRPQTQLPSVSPPPFFCSQQPNFFYKSSSILNITLPPLLADHFFIFLATQERKRKWRPCCRRLELHQGSSPQIIPANSLSPLCIPSQVLVQENSPVDILNEGRFKIGSNLLSFCLTLC